MSRTFYLLAALLANKTAALQFPSLPSLFGKPSSLGPQTPSLAQKKADLLQAVSFTNNGKDATIDTQQKVLQMVRDIETKAPPSETLLSNPEEAMALDGVWYLQYTSPSELDGEDELQDVWKPEILEPKIETNENRQFQAKGSVSAAGIQVDTSNKVVKQCFDISQSRVVNDVELDFGRVCVGGPFRQSPNVPNRALVAFEECTITLNGGLELKLGFLFDILSFFRGTKDAGWLETTFLDEDIRIGRGNKGTMFVLTRDVDAVKP